MGGGKNGDASLFVSMTRQVPSLPREFPSVPYLAVESALLDCTAAKSGKMYSVSRVVPNAMQYRLE